MTQITILVVEDQGIIAQDIRQILTDWGYAVPAIATSGQAAVQKATELQPDLVLMDIVLKGEMDGIQAAEQIRADLDIPVVFLTAHADDEILQRAKITAPYGYLLKPLKERELRTSIDIALYKYRMEKQLQERQEHWRALIEHATDIISVFDQDGTIRYQSPATERVLGYRPDALIGQSAFDPLHPQDIPKAMDAFNELLREPGSTCRMTVRCRHKDGTWRVLETVASNLLDHVAVGGIVVNCRDVTAQVQAQDALHESERRYRGLFDDMPIGLYRSTPSGQIIDANPALVELLGYPDRDTLLATNAVDTYINAEERRRYQAALNGGILRNFQMQLRHYDGHPIWVQCNAKALRDAGGEIQYYEGSLTNVTERVQAEAALRENQERYRALVEIANVLNSSLDRQQVLQHILEQLARVIEYDSASVMLLSQEAPNIVAHQGFRETSQVITPLRLKRLPHIQQVLQSRRPIIIADVHADPRWQRRKDSAYIRCWLGVPMIVQEQVIGLLNLDKEQPGYYTPQDAELAVTFANQAAIAIENTRLYEQAQKDAETKATLLREVNHRVKNNLTAIIGLLYAERRHAGMEDQPIYQTILRDLISRVQGLATVHSLLSASEWAPPLLSELSERIIRSALQSLPRVQEIHIDVPVSPVRVTPSQAHHLAMVINELATNTAKHTLEGRNVARITVHIIREGDHILLKFQDDGPGYPPQVLTLERHNVGFDLIQRIVRESLRGELTLYNAEGAVALIQFPHQVKERNQT